MPRFSEGSFGGGGGTGASSSTFDFHHRNDNYNQFGTGWGYSNPLVTTTTTATPMSPRSRAICCSCIPAISAIIGSLWLLFGFYGSQNLEAGCLYSRLLTANPLLVKDISVTNTMLNEGPMLYVFSKKPQLQEDVKSYTVVHETYVPGNHHQEWAHWLNTGSKIRIHYNISSNLAVMVAVIQGEGNLLKWTENPTDTGSTSLLQTVTGAGDIDFYVRSDNDYYFALGNLHEKDIRVKLELGIQSKVYTTKGALVACPLTSQHCLVKLSLFRNRVLLLATPDQEQGGIDVWHIRVVYNARLGVYICGCGIFVLVILFLVGRWLRRLRRVQAYLNPIPESAPLVTPCKDECHVVPSFSTPSESLKAKMDTGGGGAEGSGAEMSEDRLCIICYEAPKDSFFYPCGHSATCYQCGLRIQEEKKHICPICRDHIETVKRIIVA